MSILQAGSRVQCALLLGKSEERRREERQGLYSLRYASPQMPTAQQGSISFQQTSFCCCCFMSIMVSGLMSQSSEHRENYMEKKHYGCMPPNCGLWKQHHHFSSVISLLMFMLPKLVVHPNFKVHGLEAIFLYSTVPSFQGCLHEWRANSMLLFHFSTCMVSFK